MTVIDALLIGLLVFQQIYWSRINNKLIDKLMSRNYHEYKQAESQSGQKVRNKIVDNSPQDHDLHGLIEDFQQI